SRRGSPMTASRHWPSCTGRCSAQSRAPWSTTCQSSCSPTRHGATVSLTSRRWRMLLDADGLFIKVSGLTSEADALFAIALGANAVGFDFGPTPRQVSTTLAHDIVRRLPSGVVSVGVFRNEMPERIVAITNTLGLNAVQIEGAISKTSLRYVAERVHTIIRAVGAPHEAYEFEADLGVDYLLLPESDSHEDMLASL